MSGCCMVQHDDLSLEILAALLRNVMVVTVFKYFKT